MLTNINYQHYQQKVVIAAIKLSHAHTQLCISGNCLHLSAEKINSCSFDNNKTFESAHTVYMVVHTYEKSRKLGYKQPK